MASKTCERCVVKYSALADFCQDCYDRRVRWIALGFIVTSAAIVMAYAIFGVEGVSTVARG